MSISTLESPASVRALDRMHAESDAHEATESYLRAAFLKAAAECQPQKLALFAQRVKDRENGGTRYQTMGEVVRDALDYRDFDMRAVQVLLLAAAGRGTQREAQALLEDMAAMWADLEVTS